MIQKSLLAGCLDTGTLFWVVRKFDSAALVCSVLPGCQITKWCRVYLPAYTANREHQRRNQECVQKGKIR